MPKKFMMHTHESRGIHALCPTNVIAKSMVASPAGTLGFLGKERCRFEGRTNCDGSDAMGQMRWVSIAIGQWIRSKRSRKHKKITEM